MSNGEAAMQISNIKMADLFCDDNFNCRGQIAPIDVTDLSRSMDLHGLQLPIEVQPYDKEPGRKFRIICGHRRYKAATLLRWQEIPAIIKDGLTETAARLRNLTENLNRKDLNIAQEAKALLNLKMAGMTQEETAAQLNKSRGWIQVRFMLLELVPEIQAEAAAGLLNQEQIRDLYTMRDDLHAQAEAVRAIKEAKGRGEKVVKIQPKKENVNSKRQRNRVEIFAMIEHIAEAVDMCLATRALAWASGEISDGEFYADLAAEAREKRRHYAIPTEALSALQYRDLANSPFPT